MVSPDTRQFDPTTRQEYGYEDCEWWRRKAKPISWRKLGRRYNRHHETIRDKYIREHAKRSTKSRAVRNVHKDEVTRESQQGKSLEDLTDIELIRIKYGDIPPTLHTSKLNNDEWIDGFISYDYFTHDPEAIAELKEKWHTTYLKKLRHMLWTFVILLILLPRGYGKTESVLALFIRWILEVREPLYIVGPSYNHNKNILRRIELLLKSPAIRRKYGDIYIKASYDREMLTMTYHDHVGYHQFDPPVSLVTWAGAKEGNHPAWLHFEDVMQKEFKNIESNDDIKYKFAKTFAKMRIRRGNKRTRVTATGTRYAMEDFYSYLMEIQKFPLFHEVCLDENDNWTYCPNFTKEEMIEERELDPPSFETSMNNNPLPPAGVYFRAEDWISTDENPKEDWGVQYYMVVDPARGFSMLADNTAILVIAISNGRATIVDGFVGKIDDDDKVKKTNEFYAAYNPAFTLVEKTWAQIDMRKFQHLRGLIPYQDTTKNAKIVRISAMKPYFTDGLIRVMEDIQPYQFLYNEYIAYNETLSTPSRKDDAIDALSMIIQQFGKLLEKYVGTDTDWSEAGDFHLTPALQ